MALGTPDEEFNKITKLNSRFKNLRERMRNDFGLLTLEKFEIPTDEGEWENYTTNSPSVLGHKVMHLLSAAKRRIYVLKTQKEKKSEREKMEAAERFANGIIQQADYNSSVYPEQLFTQDAMSFFGTMGRLIIPRVVLLEDEDGNVKPDIAIWDGHNTFWITGGKGVIYIAYERYVTAESVEDDYGVKATADDNGLVALYDVWDDEENGVFCLDAKSKKDKSSKWLPLDDNKEKYKPQKHNIDHVPVGIFMTGNIPLIQDGKRKDTDKYISESIYVNNRGLYPSESRLGSYMLTRAGLSARTPLMTTYDSRLQGKPIEFANDPYVKNKHVSLDIGKGESLQEFIKLPTGEQIHDMENKLQQEDTLGGMSPVAFGDIPGQLPAAAIIALIQASMERVYPVKKAMERAFEWIAREAVIQFKDGDWNGAQLEGFDDKNQYFRTEIKPDDLDSKWHFKCDLSLDSSMAELQIQGIIESSVKAGIISKRTAMEHHPWVNDPDKEQETIDQEKSDAITGLALRRTAAALLTDGDIQGATFILAEIQKQEEQAVQALSNPQGTSPTAWIPGIPNAGAMAGQVASQPQTEADRLRKINMVPGR